jgi:hypothetical protein
MKIYNRIPGLNVTGVMITSVASDGKEREMLCLPLEFVFGWLFTIDSERVRGAISLVSV